MVSGSGGHGGQATNLHRHGTWQRNRRCGIAGPALSLASCRCLSASMEPLWTGSYRCTRRHEPQRCCMLAMCNGPCAVPFQDASESSFDRVGGVHACKRMLLLNMTSMLIRLPPQIHAPRHSHWQPSQLIASCLSTSLVSQSSDAAPSINAMQTMLLKFGVNV